EMEELLVNGKVFRVEHALDTTESGHDAFTVRNITPLQKDGVRNERGERIIVCVGSEQNEDLVCSNSYVIIYDAICYIFYSDVCVQCFLTGFYCFYVSHWLLDAVLL